MGRAAAACALHEMASSRDGTIVDDDVSSLVPVLMNTSTASPSMWAGTIRAGTIRRVDCRRAPNPDRSRHPDFRLDTAASASVGRIMGK